ncbi:hypothetical protein evm_009002 [Chilo suppressalis]|nr:hypothetical protein evm_009002 [Chilo suppressalis]
MGSRDLILALLVIGCANAQLFRVCVVENNIRCQNLDKDGSQVACLNVQTSVECALQMSRGAAHVGAFTEEELMLLAQRNTDEYRVLGTVRNVNRMVPFAFEAVAVVPNNHTNGFEGLRGGRYCHPGLGATDMRWSPRVLRTLETMSARTDRCTGVTQGRTAEELEVETLSSFFSEACRPGPWSANATIDANLKSRFPNLCAMCSASGTCAGYNDPSAVNVAGVSNRDAHIQALQCLVTNGTVAYVAWTHVSQYFSSARPDLIGNYSLLCEDGTLVPLSTEVLAMPTSPCSLVRQPWSAIVATAASADALLASLQNWWPDGQDPSGNSWESNLFSVLAGPNTRVAFESNLTPLLSPSNFTSPIRSIPAIDATASCLPARRWCTMSAAEHEKCTWIRTAAYTLGIQPAISCQQRANEFACLRDIRDGNADFISIDTHYGFLARTHFRLSPVKLVQNLRDSTSRIAALVKESVTNEISRFENLRDKVACFPEFGGLAFMAFVRTAHERGVISSSECDYARAVGEFFSGSCAPGALDASHTIYESSTFNASRLCTACRWSSPVFANATNSEFTCSWNNTNWYFGNNGSLLCLNDPNTHVAFVETQNIRAQLQALGMQNASFRALCRNNSLAQNVGVDVPEDCLIAHVVDAEVLTRRNDQITNSLSSLLDSLDQLFGYNIATAEQLINIRIYSPFLGRSDLLFKDSTIGLTEPTMDTNHQPARNYIEMFRHLETCTSAAPPTTPTPGKAVRAYTSLLTLIVMALIAKIVN